MTERQNWVSASQFRGHKGQAANYAGALELQEEEEREKRRELWENHNHASCVWFPASCQDLSLSASQTFSLSYPIPLSSPLAALPTPTLDRTQMVWIRSLHDWAVATDEILKSDSLLSLNTPD